MDFTGAIEALMWPDEFVRHKDDFVEDRVCFLKGTLERKREEPSLVLTKLMSIEQAQREMTKGLVLLMTLGEHSPEMLDAIGRVLRRYTGTCPVYLSVRDGGGRRCLLRLGEEYRINPATVSVGEIETLLGRGCVKFTGPASTGSRNGH
jgi:DNA polymerase-3 subunit alpha